MRQGSQQILQIISDRLLFLALTRKSINCLFNPRDGQRLTLRDVPAVVEGAGGRGGGVDEDGAVGAPDAGIQLPGIAVPFYFDLFDHSCKFLEIDNRERHILQGRCDARALGLLTVSH